MTFDIFVSNAQAYGIAGSRVERAESLVPTLQAAFVRGGVQLVTMPIDYSENTRVLVDKPRNHAPAGRRPNSQSYLRSLSWLGGR
jgi:acetolactate synthase I/II/III large subunit